MFVVAVKLYLNCRGNEVYRHMNTLFYIGSATCYRVSHISDEATTCDSPTSHQDFLSRIQCVAARLRITFQT